MTVKGTNPYSDIHAAVRKAKDIYVVWATDGTPGKTAGDILKAIRGWVYDPVYGGPKPSHLAMPPNPAAAEVKDGLGYNVGDVLHVPIAPVNGAGYTYGRQNGSVVRRSTGLGVSFIISGNEFVWTSDGPAEWYDLYFETYVANYDYGFGSDGFGGLWTDYQSANPTISSDSGSYQDPRSPV